MFASHVSCAIDYIDGKNYLTQQFQNFSFDYSEILFFYNGQFTERCCIKTISCQFEMMWLKAHLVSSFKLLHIKTLVLLHSSRVHLK